MVLRSPDLAREEEAELARACEAARAHAAERLSTRLGFDVAGWLDAPSATGVVHRRGCGIDGAAVARSVADLLVHHDLGDEDQGPSTTRLVRTGGGVDRDDVPDGPEVRRRDALGRPLRARPHGFAAALAGGASFKLRAVEVADDDLWRLVADLEHVAGTPTGCLAYLSGPGARGWGAHYDRHDGIVVQVEGTKRWRVHEPVEADPLRPISPYRVGDRIVWEGVLGPGEVLAVPRGWGHEVLGTAEASLHLTLPVRRPDGTDLVAGLVERIATPPRSPQAERRARLAGRARTTLAAARLLLDLLDRDDAPPPGGPRLRLASAAAVLVDEAPGATTLRVGDVELPHDRATVALLAGLVRPEGLDPSTATQPQRDHLLRLAERDHVAVLDGPHPPASPGVAPGATGDEPQGSAAPRWAPVRSAADPTPGPSHALAGRRAAAAARWRELVAGIDLERIAAAPHPGEVALGSWRGDPGDLAGAAIEHLLLTRDLDGGRLAVAHGGVAFNRRPPASLLRATDPAAPRRVAMPALCRFLRSGGTAILFGTDDSIPHLSALAWLVESVTGVRSGTNTYLSDGSATAGFGAHWDDHDVIVLQAVGTKRWRLHPPTEPAPILGTTPSAVADEVHLEVVLEPGDLLHLPRGWGHTVSGTGGPSVHHTFPLRHPTGLDVAAALVTGRAATPAAVVAARRAEVPARPLAPLRAPLDPLPTDGRAVLAVAAEPRIPAGGDPGVPTLAGRSLPPDPALVDLLARLGSTGVDPTGADAGLGDLLDAGLAEVHPR